MLVFLSSICPVLNAAFDLFASRHRQKLEKIKLNQLIVVEDLSGSILHFWVAFWKLAQFFTRPYYVDLGLEPKNSRSPRCAPVCLLACPRHVPGVSLEYPVETSDFWAPGQNRFSIVWQRSVPIFRMLLKSEVTPCIFPLRSPTIIHVYMRSDLKSIINQ